MIKKFVLAVAAVAAMGVPAMAGGKGHGSHHHHGSHHGATDYKIVVSCFRGPWREVIWDRPNPVFIDSLVSVGYDFATARAIAERICRDKTLVGNPEALKSTMESIYRNPGSHRRHNH